MSAAAAAATAAAATAATAAAAAAAATAAAAAAAAAAIIRIRNDYSLRFYVVVFGLVVSVFVVDFIIVRLGCGGLLVFRSLGGL